MLEALRNLFSKKRVKISIKCAHGEFIPGAFDPFDGNTRMYSCDGCELKIKLETFRGPINW